jgi:Mn-dependent DtxR family transcriptional regulator
VETDADRITDYVRTHHSASVFEIADALHVEPLHVAAIVDKLRAAGRMRLEVTTRG